MGENLQLLDEEGAKKGATTVNGTSFASGFHSRVSGICIVVAQRTTREDIWLFDRLGPSLLELRRAVRRSILCGEIGVLATSKEGEPSLLPHTARKTKLNNQIAKE